MLGQRGYRVKLELELSRTEEDVFHDDPENIVRKVEYVKNAEMNAQLKGDSGAEKLKSLTEGQFVFILCFHLFVDF